MSIRAVLRRSLLLLPALVALAALPASSRAASSADATVPGSANPFLSGIAAGGTASNGDTAGDPTSSDPNVRMQSPVLVQGLTISPGSVLTFSGTGAVDYSGNAPAGTPDGTTFQTHLAENGIAGVDYPLNSLVGVFLDDSTPSPTDPPADLDFSDGGNVTGGLDYLILSSPTLRLKQVFFIGDGLTSGGQAQHVSVPAGATRLFLGTADGSGWFNNTGSFSVHIASAPPASTAPAFASPQVFTTPDHADTSIIGDFDGDGNSDVAAYSGDYSGGLDIHIGDGQGGFVAASGTTFTVADGFAPGGIAGADIDADGKTELLVTSGTSVDIYSRQDDGSFPLGTSIDLTASGIQGKKIAVGNLTDSSSQDIIVSDYFGSVGIVWIPNDGNGNFGEPVVFPAGGCDYYAYPVLADVNGDGLDDVILSHFGTVGVLINNGDGTLAPEVDYSNFGAANFHTNSVAVADVNGDGYPDIIETGHYQDPDTYANTYYVSVLANNGDGTFADGVAFPLPNGANDLQAADVSNDGRADIITTDYTKSGFTVTQLSGTGSALTLARQDRFAADGIPYNSLALGFHTLAGTYKSFYGTPNTDVLLGSTVSVSGSSQFVLFKNLTGLASTPATLPGTTLVLDGTTADGGPLRVKATQSASNVSVRLQYSLTGLDGSWVDLADGNGGKLAFHSDGYYFGSSSDTGTLFYPPGSTVYLRAISSAQGAADSISNVLGPYTLKQAQLSIGVSLTSTSDTNGLLHVAHIGDDLTYTFAWQNSGTSTSATATDLHVETTVPTYIDAATNLHVQFPQTTLTFNQFGHYIPATSPTANDAKVLWDVANLPPGFSQTVTLGVHLGSAVRLDQQIGVGNDYTVYSSTNHPAFAPTGYSSGSPNVGTTIRGPIKLTVVPDVTQVAPGGFINYTITIQNLGGYTAKNVFIADPAPEFTRFVDYNPKDKSGTTFLNAKGHPTDSPAFSIKIGKKSVALNNPSRINGQLTLAHLDAGTQAFLAANPRVAIPSDKNDLALFYVGDLAKNASATVRFTVQVQYTAPANITDHEIKNFDYLGALLDPSAHVIVTQNDSGNIFTPVQGTVHGAPILSLVKTLSSHSPSPGDTVIALLAVSNTGPAAADDVFIQDRVPLGFVLQSTGKTPLALVSGSPQSNLDSALSFVGKSKSTTANKAGYFVTLDSDNRTLRINGLHLEPNETATLGYSMQVPASTAVPQSFIPGPSYVSGGNFTSTVLGTSLQGPPDSPIQVIGDVHLQTFPPLMVPAQPYVTGAAATTTKTVLDTLFKKSPTASLSGVGGQPGVANVQRYLIDYANTGANIASDVHLRATLPPNTVFYRAYFQSASGGVGKLAKGQSIQPAAQLTSGSVIFNMNTLAAGKSGVAVVEAIILPSVVSSGGSRLQAITPVIYSGASPQFVLKKAGAFRPLDVSSDAGGSIVYDGHNVPSVGVIKVLPQSVPQGGQFAVQFAIVNYGNIDLSDSCDVTMLAPAGTQIVSVDCDRGFVQSQTSTSLDVKFYPIVFGKHTANGMTITLQATGAANTVINENSIVATFPYTGSFRTKPSQIRIAPSGSPASNATTTTVSGAQFAGLGEMAVIPLGHDDDGHSQVLVSGPAAQFGSITTTDVFDVSAIGNGNRVVYGTAASIPLLNLPVVNNSDVNAALGQLPAIVSQHGGNIFNGPEANLLTPDGSLINNNTGGVLGTIKDMLKKGAVSVVAGGNAAALPKLGGSDVALVGSGQTNANGAGFIFTQGGGVVSNDGASLIGQDGGGLIGDDGSSLIGEDGSSLIGQDGGGLIGQDGGGLIGQDGGGLISSPASASFTQTAGGNFMGGGR